MSPRPKPWKVTWDKRGLVTVGDAGGRWVLDIVAPLRREVDALRSMVRAVNAEHRRRKRGEK